MDKYVLHNFKLYWSNIANDAEEIYEGGYLEILAKLTDGSLYSYYDEDNTIRRVFKDCDNPTEQEFKRDFGIRLRRMILRKHMTQEMLSSKTGLSEVTISKYVNGKAVPNTYNVRLLTTALKCNLDDLVI